MIDINKLADRHERLHKRHQSAFGSQLPDAGVVIVADPNFIRTFSGQVTWATLLNLIARLYKGIRHIRIVVDSDVPRLSHVFFPNASEGLRAASLRFLEQLNEDAFTIGEGLPPNDGPDWIWIHVGAWDPRHPPGTAVAGQGWLAFVNDESWRGLASVSNPIGPMVAACLGTAEIYKALYPLSDKREQTRIVLSAFDYSADLSSNPVLPASIHLPETYIAGCGAVGMALLLLLNSTPAISSGSGLHVVEDDALDDTNMNRCVLTILEDVNSRKTKIIEERLDTARLALKTHDLKWQAFVHAPEYSDALNFERVVSCVDKYSAREAVQYDRLPKVLLTAGTGDFLLSVSRHVLDDGLSCGLCYQAKDPEVGCAIATEGAQRAFEVPVDPSISFVSACAGVLLGGELLKEIIPELNIGRIQNTVRMQVLTGAAKEKARAKDPGCNCSSKYVAIGYKNTWRSSDVADEPSSPSRTIT
ncbi:ThiF family adenylyltransferase [Bradyrhizobium sp. URHD0069]|uniref:ThiF family adenylyltransferase n=1 Tax=Bradyrhizobium sp. URHD0069 TaxID=1380355 RepID=UPI000496D6C8|nr:ThiF family adenylyltransferase [Bradyrhizobium sp. URHD0069]